MEFGSFHRKYDDDDDGKKMGKGFANFGQRMGEQMLTEMEENEPQVSDVGFFIEETILSDWWNVTKAKFPQLFEDDEKQFPQHSFGTKLRAYFNDPQKPIQVSIVGSKMFSDGARYYGGENDKTPYYIVKYRGCCYTELGLIAYLDAHEDDEEDINLTSYSRWRVGWNDVDEKDEEYDKLVEIASTNRLKKENEEEGVVLDYNSSMDNWEKEDGPFADAFWMISFTPSEQKQLTKQQIRSKNISLVDNDNITLRKLLMRLVLAWEDDSAGGAIITNKRRTKFQVIEFYGPIKEEKNKVTIPIVDIQYGNAANMNDAELFLRDEKIHVIECSDALAKTFENHIMQNAVGKGLNDVLSGLVLFEARLVPIEPSSSNVDAVSPPCSFRNNGIPNGTFGIEFELLCAIGTQPQTVGFALKEHAGIIVKLRERKFSRPGYRYTYFGCSKEEVDGHEWMICHDGSIQTNPDWAHSSPWELVSPILSGKEGLEEAHRVLTTVTDTSAIQINNSMGMHVHIGVDTSITLEELKSICQNFLLYEDVMDSFLGRTDNKYCHGHAKFITSKEILSCHTKQDLYAIMNPEGRYHKLNLQNLKTGRRPTIEFRQHSANRDATKAEAWIRFCMALVHHSLSTITVVKRQNDCNSAMDDLFDTLIRDRSLKEYYQFLSMTSSNVAQS